MTETIVLGGGCFWCVEAVLTRLRGVVSVVPGYAGGEVANPTSEQVYSGKTGHAEVVKVVFDPAVIPTNDLLDIFFHTHNPTTVNQQGADVGPQYRSIVLYTTQQQKIITLNAIEKMNNTSEYSQKVVTEVKKLEQFYEAQEHHKRYYEKNSYEPYCQIVIDPKIA